MTIRRDFPSRTWQVFLTILFMFLLATPALVALAQVDDRVGAPGKLSVESTGDGLVLSWEAPVSKEDPVAAYEISGLHVRRGTGIVKRVAGSTDGNATSWTDREATDPELLYVYRVRAWYSSGPGQWSGFVITGFERVPLTPSTPVVPIEPTPVVPEPSVEPTAALPQPEPTRAVPVVPVEPTAAPPQPKPTRAAAPQAAPEGTSGQAEEPPAPTAVPPQPEPTRAAPAAPVQPTAAPPQPEPTAARPEPEPTAGSGGPGT